MIYILFNIIDININFEFTFFFYIENCIFQKIKSVFYSLYYNLSGIQFTHANKIYNAIINVFSF